MAANAKDKERVKPRLKNLDELFQLNVGGQSESGAEAQPNGKRTVTPVAVENLKAFRGHPFRLYEGERLDDMIESVKTNGILVPIIARRTDKEDKKDKEDGKYEILAGHNRVNAARLAGLDEVPAIVLEDISDEEAMVYVVETNLIQRSFTDMTHSEKAAVIALHHSKMFSQGKRNDIIEQLKTLEKSCEYDENPTSSQLAKKSTTIEKVGELYSLSKDTVARYLRINRLIPKLKSRLDDGGIAFIPAVTLSFLKEDEQNELEQCIERHSVSVDMKKAESLRQYSANGRLDSENILQILTGETIRKSNHTPTVKLSKSAYAKYFSPNQSAKEIQDIVEKALELYFKHK